MKTFGHLDPNGYAIDVKVRATIDAYRLCFPQVSDQWQILELPDLDTNGDPLESGARSSDGGLNYTNPAKPPPVQIDVVLVSGEFGNFLSRLLNADPLTGRAKLRQILEAAAARAGVADSDYRTRDFKDWFYSERSFDKPTVTNYLTDLVSSGVITAGQKNAVLAGWPKK